jgi:hypothetical protein
LKKKLHFFTLLHDKQIVDKMTQENASFIDQEIVLFALMDLVETSIKVGNSYFAAEIDGRHYLADNLTFDYQGEFFASREKALRYLQFHDLSDARIIATLQGYTISSHYVLKPIDASHYISLKHIRHMEKVLS